MWASFPLGAMIGGFTNSFLLPALGWRAIFYLGGVLPLVVAVVLTIWLPESLKFLITRPGGNAEALRIVRRMGAIKDDQNVVLTVDEEQLTGPPLRHVFTEGRAIGTLLLWVPFFMGFGILTVAVLWTPTLLRLNGISPAATAFVVAFNGLGACLGQGASGYLIERFGVIRTMAPAFLFGAAATAGLGYGSASVAAAATFIGLNGVFLGIGSAGAIALAALIYPTALRSTGVGLGMAMGRFGQVIGPLVAGAMLGSDFSAGQIMLAISLGAVLAAIFVVLFQAWLAARQTTSIVASRL
jgi:AAHS family 4-hydroxybenzoate transporter-like MFS transporter